MFPESKVVEKTVTDYLYRAWIDRENYQNHHITLNWLATHIVLRLAMHDELRIENHV